jgi:hypothetical protein
MRCGRWCGRSDESTLPRSITPVSISPLTVKRHTISLYEELSVPGRRQAVARARALGVLHGPDVAEVDP